MHERSEYLERKRQEFKNRKKRPKPKGLTQYLKLIRFIAKLYPAVVFFALLMTLSFLWFGYYAIDKSWGWKEIIALVTFGSVSILLESFLSLLFIKQFRSKNVKSIVNGKAYEYTNETSSKGELLITFLISALISILVLFFLNNSHEVNYQELYYEYFYVCLCGIFLILLSVIKVIVISVSGKTYDLSKILIRKWTQPLSLFLTVLVSGFLLHFGYFGFILFLILYVFVGVIKSIFSALMMLPEDDNRIEQFIVEMQSPVNKA